MSVFFYVQHLLGIGHLKRAATLAQALRDAGFKVVLASGGVPVPGEVDSNAIGQRRWALEWAVVFTGPYHEEPPEWEEVDLSV